MLTDLEFLNWCDRLQLLEKTVELIQSIRTCQLARYSSTVNRFSGWFPSEKMGLTIPYDSPKICHMIELYEKDRDVLEYYANSTRIYLDYESKSGRRVYHPYTPDFFVVRLNGAGWEDFNSEENLIKLAQNSPNRWFQEGGHWHQLPVENYVKTFNLFYKLGILQAPASGS
jgi:hypothetical protein